jgi:ABC-type polysaccharide/polyol phosphate transport system ATPase subunit
LVSHAEEQIQRLCQRAILLEQGLVVAEGDCAEVLARYGQGAP